MVVIPRMHDESLMEDGRIWYHHQVELQSLLSIFGVGPEKGLLCCSCHVKLSSHQQSSFKVVKSPSASKSTGLSFIVTDWIYHF